MKRQWQAGKWAHIVKGWMFTCSDVLERIGAKRVALKLRRWLGIQWVEIRRELRFAWNPPVRVRRHGDRCVAVRTKAVGEAASLLLLPLGGHQVMRVECVTTRPDAHDAETHSVIASASDPEGRQQWMVGRFTDHRDAVVCTEIIAKALAGNGGQGKRMAGGVAAALVAMVGFSMFRPGGAREGEAQASAPPATPATPAAQVSSLMQEAFGSGMTAEAIAHEGVPASVPNALGSTGDSLADQIYAESMAAAKQSQYTMGPPAGPSRDITAGDFGLGVSSKEGCDPALKFKVAAP